MIVTRQHECVNTPAQKNSESTPETPLTLSELAVYLQVVATEGKPIKRWRLKTRTGLSLRTVAYKLKSLKTRGWVTATPNFVPNNKGYTYTNAAKQKYVLRRLQQPSSYTVSDFAPLSLVDLTSILKEIRSRCRRGRGAKCLALLEMSVLGILKEMAQRLKVGGLSLLGEMWPVLTPLLVDVRRLWGVLGDVHERLKSVVSHQLYDPETFAASLARRAVAGEDIFQDDVKFRERVDATYGQGLVRPAGPLSGRYLALVHH